MKQTLAFLLVILALIANAVASETGELLPPSLAFRPTVQAIDGNTVEIRFDIAKGYYLYRDKFRVTSLPPGANLGVPVFPKGKEKTDETFGRVEVFYDTVAFRVPVERNSSGRLPLNLSVTSQGCADIGVCYPPETQRLSVELPDPAAAPAAAPPVPAGDESGRIVAFLADASPWLVAGSFFGFGLLLSLTPCVFPMLPILSGIIVGAGSNNRRVSPMRGFLLSLAYVLGMALTYAAAGVAAGLSGTYLAAALQNAWVLGGFAALFVVLALSMFGLYELQMPSILQSGASAEAARLKGGSIPAVALMGALSAIIVGPCVAAPLAGALLYIGQTGNAILGALALFSMALGMGVPLILVGVSAGTLLPRAGPWMASVKQAFGVILLATALWIVSPLIPISLQMAAWAVLLIVPAIFMRAVDPLPPQATAGARLWKGFGMLMLITGTAMLIGALSGARDPLQPLAPMMRSADDPQASALQFEPIRTRAALDARLRTAGTPVLLDFYADWCVSCKEMERFTFTDPEVRRTLAGWTLLRADVTGNSDEDRALLARFRLFGPPGIIFFNAAGEEQPSTRVIGFQRANVFLQTLRTLPAGSQPAGAS